MNYFSGNPLRDPLVKCTKDGIPLILGDLIRFVRVRQYLVIAIIFTVLFSTRSLKIGKNPDTSSITQPCKGDVPDITKHMGSFWRILGYRPAIHRTPRALRAGLDDFRTKSGPNGQALTSSHLDLLAAPDSLIQSLSEMGGMKFGSVIRKLKDPRVDAFLRWAKVYPIPKGRNSFRRLGYFADKENKVRVVGILDYFSQLALKPLHLYLTRALSKIRQDCTLDQGKHKELLLNKGSGKYFSIDLTAATDRFPITVIEQLLRKQLPERYVSAWKDVMVGYPFDYKTKKLSYLVGNPMGAYSSFASFALAHHYIIYYCCKELGIRWKSLPYALLGDDIVIRDSNVAVMYKKIISDLGVEFSVAKTHESENFFEFAKRIYLDGIEITPFPISALKEAKKSFSMITVLLCEVAGKGWHFSDIPSSVGDLYSICYSFSSRRVKSSVDKSRKFKGVLETVQGLIPANQYINWLIGEKQYPLPTLSEEICKNIFSNAVVEAFADSNLASAANFYAETDLPLIEKARSLLKAREHWLQDELGINPRSPAAIGIFDHNDLPVVRAAFAVQKLYKELEQKLFNLDSTGSNWTYEFRHYTLPKSDKTFFDRGSYVLAKSVNNFAHLIEQRLDILVMYPSLLDIS